MANLAGRMTPERFPELLEAAAAVIDALTARRRRLPPHEQRLLDLELAGLRRLTTVLRREPTPDDAERLLRLVNEHRHRAGVDDIAPRFGDDPW